MQRTFHRGCGFFPNFEIGEKFALVGETFTKVASVWAKGPNNSDWWYDFVTEELLLRKKEGFIRLVVCAAILNKTNGMKICGPRHGDCINFAIESGIDTNPGHDTWELGFVDQDNKFMSRAEAWRVADVAGLIRRPTGYELNYKNFRCPNIGDEGLLFSENLY